MQQLEDAEEEFVRVTYKTRRVKALVERVEQKETVSEETMQS